MLVTEQTRMNPDRGMSPTLYKSNNSFGVKRTRPFRVYVTEPPQNKAISCHPISDQNKKTKQTEI